MALINWIGLVIISCCVLGLIWLGWRLRLRWWQSLILRIIVVVLVGLSMDASIKSDRPEEYLPEILIMDRSDSISEDSLIKSQGFANVWKSMRPKRQVIVFGTFSDHVLSENWPDVASGGSNLNSALTMAENVFGDDPGRVILATDGLVENSTIVEEWVEQFSTDGGKMDFIQLDRVRYHSDLFVGQIKGTSSVWSGMRFPVFLPVFANGVGEANLQIFVNGNLYKESTVQINEGETILQLLMQAGSPGVMNVEVRLVVEEDQFLGNNSTFASFRVYEQPKILFVTKNVNAVEKLINGLQDEGSQVSVITPDLFPTAIEDLETFQVIMVHDILAQDFNFEQMQAIKLHVLELGKGVVFLGGRNSYTLGGYQNTILEPLMPIRLFPPDRVQRVPITFLLVLDRSGSMAGDRNTDIAPIDLTREAAMRAIETLRSDDYLGVLTFSGTTNWDVELDVVGEGLDLRNAQDKVSRIVAVGGTFMYQALEEAVNQIMVTDTTDYPHILLMSDGVSGDGSMDEFIRLVQGARENGITISTIALGNESDPETLARIAEVSGGRFYQVYDPADLPRVMISESRAVQAENIQEGRTNLIQGVKNHPILAGFSLDELPLLIGYIATQSKSNAGAEDVLLSGNFGDPLLSVWQVGLGQVAAWMGDLGELWNPGMEDWEKQGIFWQQVARYTIPDPSIGESDVGLSVDDMEMKVELSLNEDVHGNTSLNPKWVQATAGQLGEVYSMPQVSAGKYQIVLQDPEVGAYTGIIQYSYQGVNKDLLVPYAVNYPNEWHFEDPEIGKNRINSWLEISNGTKLSYDLELENSMNLDRGTGTKYFNITLILLIVSWPVEIAIRRWQMPWRRA